MQWRWRANLPLILAALMVIAGLATYFGPAPKEQTLEDFLKTLPAIADSLGSTVPEVSLFERDLKTRPEELTLPSSFFPNGANILSYREWLLSIERCGPKPSVNKGDNQSRKLEVEWEVKCNQRQSVPQWVWGQPPLIHPAGGSWAWHIVSRLKDFKIADSWFHLLELPRIGQIQDKKSIFTQEISPEALAALLQARPVFLVRENLFLYTAGSVTEKRYLQITADEYKTLAQHWPFRFVSDINAECLVIEETGCWKRAGSILGPLSAWLLWGGLVCLMGLLATQLYLERKRKRQAEAHRELAAIAISHEIRHPVTSLMLSLEAMRSHIEELPPEVQSEYLRMGQEVRRLKRLTAASETFFRIKDGEKPAWKVMPIQSVHQFFKRLCDSYQVQCELVLLDRAFRTDPYWLGIAIENLVKNAKNHGQPPVQVEVREKGGALLISVRDAGRGFAHKPNFARGNVSPAQAGLGYGLYLTSMIIKNLGGDLSWSSQPTEFRIQIKDLPDENNSAR